MPDKIDIARIAYLAMTALGMSKREALRLTPVEFDTLYREWLKEHNPKALKRARGGIDNLP